MPSHRSCWLMSCLAAGTASVPPRRVLPLFPARLLQVFKVVSCTEVRPCCCSLIPGAAAWGH